VGKTDFESMKKAIVYGSAMASYCVEKFGTERLQELTVEMLNERLAKFDRLMRLNA